MKDDLSRYRDNLQEETDAEHVYRAMAASEKDPRLAEIYSRLADAERRHAEFWRDQLARLGRGDLEVRPSGRARILAWLTRRFGPRMALPTMARQEAAGKTRYDDQPEAAGTPLPADEREHAELLASLHTSGVAAARGLAATVSEVETDSEIPRADASSDQGHTAVVRAAASRMALDGQELPGPLIARLEGRHRSLQGNTLRAAVLGANDGLVSNLSLIMGVAGAQFSRAGIVIAGLAGLLAGSISMALGEWLSVKSSQELYEHEMEIEAQELDAHPEAEAEELQLIFQSKGMREDQAAELSKRLIQDKQAALDTMAREELGIDPAELGGSPLAAAGASFALFSVGAVVPVIPFLFAGGWAGVVTSLGLSAMGLFGLGAATTLITGKSWVKAGARSFLIGLAAAAATFGIGRALGISIGG